MLNFSVPWGAVYAADAEGNVIDSSPRFGRSTNPWKLYSCTVALTRYWQCSTAQFTVTRPILSIEQMTLDFVKELGLAPEDPIVIDLGYASVNFSDNHVTRRKRVFFGYIDTINVKLSSKGMKVTFSCRDPMRFLLDNKFSGQIFGNGFQIQTRVGFSYSRDEKSLPLDPKEVETALREGSAVTDAGAFALAGDMAKHKIMAWLIYAGSNGGCLPAPLRERGDLSPGAGFTMSGRPIARPTDVQGQLQGFNMMNQFPMQVIKHLGSLEAEPRELFADVDSGRICWLPRFSNRLDNPHVYSFLLAVGDTPANILSAEQDWSSVGAINELILINPVASTQQSSPGQPGSGVLNVSARLPDNRFFPEHVGLAFPGMKNFTRRTRYIFDDTISAEDIEPAKNLLDAMLRIWGKDIRAGTIWVPGNEELRPGDAMQVYNCGFFSGDTFRAEAVTHKMIAVGPNKGFRSQCAYAEIDEDRERYLLEVKQALGEDAFYFNEVNGARDMNIKSNFSEGGFQNSAEAGQ